MLMPLTRLMSVLRHFCIMSSPGKAINDDANCDHPPSIHVVFGKLWRLYV